MQAHLDLYGGGSGETPPCALAVGESLLQQEVAALCLVHLELFSCPQWSCCGARGPNDWNLNIYFNCTDLNPSRERCGVPFSCCVRDPAVSRGPCGEEAQPEISDLACFGNSVWGALRYEVPLQEG